MERKGKMAVNVIIHPGKLSEEEFKAAVERYVRKWIFDMEGDEHEKEKNQNQMVQRYGFSECSNKCIVAD